MMPLKKQKPLPLKAVEPFGCFALFGLLASASFLTAQEVVTAPIGYVKLGNTTEGENAVAANTDVFLTIPLEAELQETRRILSTTATTITVEADPAWVDGQWAPNPTPFCAIISSGDESGIRAVISTNTSNTLTVELTSPGDLTNVSSGDTLTIRECWTLSTFFGPMNLPSGVQVFLRDNTLTGVNQAASDIFRLTSSGWRDGRTAALSNNVVLHSGETFVLRSGNTPIPELALFGDVPVSNLRNILFKDGPATESEDLFISSMSPVPSLLSASNFPASQGDQLLVFSAARPGVNQPASSIFIFTGNNLWRNARLGTDVTSSLTLEPGVGYVIRRGRNSPVSTPWTEPAPFENPPSN